MIEISSSMEEIRELIEKYALQNAVKYKAAPNAGAVMGKLMGEHPELRGRAKEVSPLVKEVLAEVEKTSPEEWQKRLEAIAPELLVQLSEKKEPDKGLPALEGRRKWRCDALCSQPQWSADPGQRAGHHRQLRVCQKVRWQVHHPL